jgi:hypothetical protein
MIRFVTWLAVGMVLTATASPVGACEILDRACWEAKRAGVVNPDSSGQNLIERNQSCEDMLMDVHNTGQRALQHLYARDQVFSPNGRGVDYDNPTGGVGYIDHGYVQQIEREIQTIVNVAIRDARYVRYDGANLGQCRTITEDAKSQINEIKAAQP